MLTFGIHDGARVRLWPDVELTESFVLAYDAAAAALQQPDKHPVEDAIVGLDALDSSLPMRGEHPTPLREKLQQLLEELR